MAGRPPKPPRSESPRSGQGASSASARCEKCGTSLDSGDLFCPSCGSPRPSSASGRPSSARAPREDQTYQDPLFVNGVYHCPRCNAVLQAGSRRCAACGVMFMHPIPEASRSSTSHGPTPNGGPPRPDPFCQNCGTPLNPNDAFCASCGAGQDRTDTGGASSPNPQGGRGNSANGVRSGPSASEQAAPRQPQGRAASAVQSVVSKRWFWPAWNSLSAAWNLALWVAALCGVGVIVSAAVHHFQSAGLNGVYEASDGFGYVTFWPSGTYQRSGMGLSTTGRYEIEHDGSVNMLAQYKAELHPGPNASADAQATALFGNMFASGMEKATLSTDKVTFQWQGHTYSYYGKPTTGPPAVPEPSAPQVGSGDPPRAASVYEPPTSEQLQRSQPKAGDVFQTDTTVDPDSDPTQTMRRAYQNSPGAGQ